MTEEEKEIIREQLRKEIKDIENYIMECHWQSDLFRRKISAAESDLTKLMDKLAAIV